jgi:hypothetical protein
MAGRIAGQKWMEQASYLTDEERASALAEVELAKDNGWTNVKIRPATYIGEDCRAVITIVGSMPGKGYGEAIHSNVYKGAFAR